jgi:hypothetical protein
MKTPYLDNEIKDYEAIDKNGYLTDDGKKYLREFKEIKRVLNLANINNSGAMVCDHSHGFYFDENGIITCVKCHPPKDKQTDC